MRTVFYKKLFYVLSFAFCALIIEFLTFNVMGLGAFPQMFVFDLLFIGLIALIIFIIPSFKVEATLIIIMLLAQSLLSFVNQAMHKDPLLKTIFTFDQLNVAIAAAGVFKNDFVSWPFLIGLVTIILVEVAFLIFLRRIKVRPQLKYKSQVAFIVAFLALTTFISTAYGKTYNSLYSPSSNSEDLYLANDDKKLFTEPDYTLKLNAFKKYGTYAFYYRNLINTLKEPEDIKDSLKSINSYLSEGEFSIPTPFNGVYKGNNLIMIMMESSEWYGISPELTPTLYALTQSGITSDSYISKNKTNQSEAISILGSYPTKSNIQAELKSDVQNDYLSYPFALPQVFKKEGYRTAYFHNNTASFYKRVETHNALGFQNLYFWDDLTENPKEKGKIYVTKKYKTSESSFYDFESDYVFLDAISNQNLINPNEQFMSFYTSMSMHGNYDDMVDFIDDYIDSDDLVFEYEWDYLNDDPNTQTELERKFKNSGIKTNEFFCKYYPKITKEYFLNKFYDSLNKLDYVYKDLNGNVLIAKGRERTVNLIYLRYKQYQAAYMDFDAGINRLILSLHQKGQLQDTTIFLFADHDAYFHNQNFTLRGYTTEDYYNLDLYTVPYILYDGSRNLKLPNLNYVSQIPSKITVENSNGTLYNNGNGDKVTRWITGYDTTPTMLDLFGYSFNRNLYHGISAFSNVEEVDRSAFCSFESGAMNNKIFLSGEQFYFYKDSLGDVYIVTYIKDLDAGELEFHQDSAVPTPEKLTEICNELKIFRLQYNNFNVEKQDMLEGIYDFKYFSFNKISDSNYDFADISKSIKKVQI